MRKVAGMAVVVGLMGAGRAALAADPTGAELMTQVWGQEAWVGQVKSLRVEMSVETTHGAEAIAQERARVAHFAGGFMDPQTNLALRAIVGGTEMIVLDAGHVRVEAQRGGVLDECWVWDGARAIRYLSGPAPVYGASVFIAKTGQQTGALLGWPRAGGYAAPGSEPAKNLGKAADYAVMGRVMFRGEECFVVSRGMKSLGDWPERWLVSVNGHHLMGERAGLSPGRAEMAAELGKLMPAGGKEHTDAEVMARLVGMPEAEQRQVETAAYNELLVHGTPALEWWFGAWQEVAAGKWYPMQQGSVIYGCVDQDNQPVEKPFVVEAEERRVTKVELDTGVAAGIFTLESMKVPVGTEVNDEAGDSRVEYRYGEKGER